jgi:hypothetical protein
MEIQINTSATQTSKNNSNKRRAHLCLKGHLKLPGTKVLPREGDKRPFRDPCPTTSI